MSEHQERFEVIAAFADGERVDTHALRAALADEAGRDYLIDLVALREVVTTGATRATGPAGSPTGSAGPDAHRVWQRSRAMTGLAAALALAVGLAGYAIGQQRSRVVPVAVLAPLVADVVVAMEAPPLPTQVIRLGEPSIGEPGTPPIDKGGVPGTPPINRRGGR